MRLEPDTRVADYLREASREDLAMRAIPCAGRLGGIPLLGQSFTKRQWARSSLDVLLASKLLSPDIWSRDP